MTRHPRSMPAGLKKDVNSMRSVELNNIGLIQKQPKISMLNTRLSCFELTSSPDQSVVINRTYSGFHCFQIYRWREKKKNALLISFAAVFWHFTQHSLGEYCLTCQKTAEKEASYLWSSFYIKKKNNSLCTFYYSTLTLNYVPMSSNHYFLSCNYVRLPFNYCFCPSMITQWCLSDPSLYYRLLTFNYSISISIDYLRVPEPAKVLLNT